ncbi:MAG: AAA family ATPase [Prevotella sp.]|nr:AAA family ATPase [Prevotella sp.]
MEAFFRTHAYLVEHTNAPVRRLLMDEIDWSHRMIGIKGTRGVGKTTFLLQYAKEHFPTNDKKCLYVNMNNFYFQKRGIADFAGDFYKNGGKVLLIDQIFKDPNWSQELRKCYDLYPNLKIVFTGSSVMRLKEENPELNGIVKSYNLRGFSFREFINLHTGLNLRPYTLEEILTNHEQIIRSILPHVSPLKYFQDYIHHGFYPFHLEQRNYSENLLKTMNMMIEVDILLINQMEQKNLNRIKRLLYLLATGNTGAPNVSQLASEVQTSRTTIMNYMKFLSDARLVNMIYRKGDEFPKKPARLMLHNTNLMHGLTPGRVNRLDMMETFFQNAVSSKHRVNVGDRSCNFILDGKARFRIQDEVPKRKSTEVIYVCTDRQVGDGAEVPLWMFGLIY